MAATYTDADEARYIATRLIADYHPQLRDATILYLFTDQKRMSKGKQVLGTMQKLSPMQKYLTRKLAGDDEGADFVMVLDYEAWQRLSETQQVALVDHELLHATVTYDENDTPAWGLRDHDFSGFVDEIERHGLWRDDAVMMAHAFDQLRLPLGEPVARS